MKKLVCLIPFTLLFFGLSGCATLGIGTKSTVEAPSKLTKLTPKYQAKQLWAERVGSGSGNYKLNPAYKQGVLYTSDARGDITATDSANGHVKWHVRLKKTITSGPGVGGSVVVVPTDEGELVALNREDGKTLWHQTISREVLAAPVVRQGIALVKTVDGNIYAFNAQSGTEMWRYAHGAPTFILRGSSSPQVSGNRVVAGFADGKLAVLNLHSGTVLWNRIIAMPKGMSDVEKLVDIDASPVVKGGSIFVATYQGKIDSLNIANGQLFWTHKISTYADLSTGTDRVFLADANSHLWAFDMLSGAVDWHQQSMAYRTITTPAVMRKTIAIGDAEGYIQWLNKADGQIVARTQLDRRGINADPLVVGNTLYALSKGGVLAAYQLVNVPHA